MQPQVTYLGHKVSKEGIQPMDDKVEAITNAPSPTNVSELKSYLGLINYYQKFPPNLSSLLAPLHRLLQKVAVWRIKVVPEVIKTIGTLRPPTGTDITKPIESLFNKKKPIPTMTVARIQRWALTLAAYKYTIEYKPGAQISESIAYHPSNSFACWTLVGKETEVKIGLSISWSGQKSACPLVCSEREAWLACEEVHREGRRRGVC